MPAGCCEEKLTITEYWVDDELGACAIPELPTAISKMLHKNYTETNSADKKLGNELETFLHKGMIETLIVR